MSIISPEITRRFLKIDAIFPIGKINLFLIFNLVIVVICGFIFDKKVILGSIILESMILMSTLVWVGLQGMDFRETFRLKCPSIKEVGITVIIVSSGIYIASFIDQLFRFYLQNFGTIQESNIPNPQSISELMVTLAAVAILPALAEEALFRGFILKSYEQYLSTGKAVFFSSLLFGMAHLSINNFWGPFVLGLLCGWLVCIFDSIFVAVIGHLLNNGLTIICFYLAPNLGDDKTVTFKDLIIGFPPFVIAGIILLMLILRYKTNIRVNSDKKCKLSSVLKHWSTCSLFFIFSIFAVAELMMRS